MISVKNVSKSFGNIVAVNDVSFEVAEGETLVLLGTSGSGKTTMLRMINRLIEPTSGDIFINNENIKIKKPELLRRHIGYVLQGYGLFPHYTVAENISIVPRLLHWPNEKIQDRVDTLLEKLQLPPSQYRRAYPDALSGGQKQRVGLARALAADPPVLLMDEPFGALDPLTRADVRKEFNALDELKQKTIILVTHDVTEAFELGDKICLMDKGSVVQVGRAADLLFKPANEFVSNFFAHQGLQLALQSIPVSTVWNELPAADTAGHSELNTQASLWNVMECLTMNGSPVTVLDETNGETRSIEFSSLQNALQNRKQYS